MFKKENELKATIFSKENENEELTKKINEYERSIEACRQELIEVKSKLNVSFRLRTVDFNYYDDGSF